MLLTYLLFSDKELCFHKALPYVPLDLLEKENVIGERSVEKATKTSAFILDSCKILHTKK